MFLFCIVFLQKCSIHIRYLGKCLKLYKNVTYSVCVFCAFNCLFEKKMNKICVLDLVSQFFRTRNNYFNIFKKSCKKRSSEKLIF